MIRRARKATIQHGKCCLHNLYCALTQLCTISVTPSAIAAQVDITARFLPNNNNPNVNKFENTTINSGYCANYPAYCTDGTFSIAIPNQIDATPMVAGQGIGISVPYSWQDLQVTHPNGTTQTLKIRITGMGAQYWLRPTESVSIITGGSNAHAPLWEGGAWLSAPNGCRSTTVGGFNNWVFTYFWLYDSANPCIKVPRFSAPSGLAFRNLNFMYELQTPNPLEMSMGIYTGAITYTLGPAGDIKFAQGAATDEFLTLNFQLSVQHNLNVQFPANADRLTLQPQGGWQQWMLNGDRYRPKKLIANQTFQQWASSRFKMQLRCQHPIGEDCGIQKGTRLVPVKTMVTLPNSLLDENKGLVNRRVLSNTIPSVIQPTRYANNERASLHFEVDQEGISKMIDGDAAPTEATLRLFGKAPFKTQTGYRVRHFFDKTSVRSPPTAVARYQRVDRGLKATVL